jgi:hypothetical protein
MVGTATQEPPVTGDGRRSGGSGSADGGAPGATSGEPPLSQLGQFLIDVVDELDAMMGALHEEGMTATVAAGLTAAWQELHDSAVECANSFADIELKDEDLSAVGLAGDQLAAKLSAFGRARQERESRRGAGATFDTLRAGGRLVRRIGAKVLGSVLSVLGDNTKWKAVLEAVKELLELLDQAADESAVRQHHAGPADADYLTMLGYQGF